VIGVATEALISSKFLIHFGEDFWKTITVNDDAIIIDKFLALDNNLKLILENRCIQRIRRCTCRTMILESMTLKSGMCTTIKITKCESENYISMLHCKY
jgi:hypothetical protein